MVRFYTLVISAIFLIASGTANAQFFTHTDSYHRLSAKVCKKRQQNQPKWQKGRYAFAISADGLHCGWSAKKSKAKYAAHGALRSCKRYAHTPCRLVYAK